MCWSYHPVSYTHLEFKKLVSGKYEHVVEVEYVYQDVETIPEEKRNPKRKALYLSLIHISGVVHFFLRRDHQPPEKIVIYHITIRILSRSSAKYLSLIHIC